MIEYVHELREWLTVFALIGAMVCMIVMTKEVKELAQITKDEVLGLLRVVRQLLATDSNNRAEIERLKAEARASDWTRDPDLDAEIEQTLSEVGDGSTGTPMPATPGASRGEDSGTKSYAGEGSGVLDGMGTAGSSVDSEPGSNADSTDATAGETAGSAAGAEAPASTE